MKGIRIRGQSIQLDFSFRGIRCRETLKLEPTKRNLAYAKGLLATILHEIAMGTFTYSKHFPDSPRALAFDGRKLARATVQEALEAYMASKKPLLQYSTCKDYEASIIRHLVPAFGHVPIKDLNARMVREWMASLPLSAKRINNIMVPLRGMMKEAFIDGLIEKTRSSASGTCLCTPKNQILSATAKSGSSLMPANSPSTGTFSSLPSGQAFGHPSSLP